MLFNQKEKEAGRMGRTEAERKEEEGNGRKEGGKNKERRESKHGKMTSQFWCHFGLK